MRTQAHNSFDRLLVLGRWVILASVLLTLFLEHTVQIERVSLVALLAIGAAYNLFLHLWISNRPLVGRQRSVVVAADLLLVTGIIYFSEGIGSPYFGIYYLVIIAATIQHGLRGGLIAATAAVALVLIEEELTEVGRERLTDIDRLLSTIPFLFLVAIATGFLVRQLAREIEQRRRAELRSRELQFEQERVAVEMEFAKAVQTALTPAELISVPGVDIAADSLPAREIGGDLYDLSRAPSGTLMATVIDVSGKGIPAALALSGLKSMIDHFRGTKLPNLLADLNRYTIEQTPEEMFATMAVCLLNPQSGVLEIASAGHEPVMIVRAESGAVETVQGEGLPLGVERDTSYSLEKVKLEEGDMVIMYTDGVTDARRNGEPLDFAGLAEIAVAKREASPQDVLQAVFGLLGSDYDVQDDATLVILKLAEAV